MWDQWFDAYLKLGLVTDRLGMPVDGNIRFVCAALNVCGFETLASCEGHFGWGLSFPWIDIKRDQHEAFDLLYQQYTPFSDYRVRYVDKRNDAFRIASMYPDDPVDLKIEEETRPEMEKLMKRRQEFIKFGKWMLDRF